MRHHELLLHDNKLRKKSKKFFYDFDEELINYNSHDNEIMIKN
jgi:hypothetical protein